MMMRDDTVGNDGGDSADDHSIKSTNDFRTDISNVHSKTAAHRVAEGGNR